MDKMDIPIDTLHQIANTMSEETDTFLQDHRQHWKKIHETSAALPTRMQAPFSTFHTMMETHFLGIVTLHRHIGETLAGSADLTRVSEDVVKNGFDSFQ